MVSTGHHPSPSSVYLPSHAEFLYHRALSVLAFPACSGHSSHCWMMNEWTSDHLTSSPLFCAWHPLPQDLCTSGSRCLDAAGALRLGICTARSFITAKTSAPERPSLTTVYRTAFSDPLSAPPTQLFLLTALSACLWPVLVPVESQCLVW